MVVVAEIHLEPSQSTGHLVQLVRLLDTVNISGDDLFPYETTDKAYIGKSKFGFQKLVKDKQAINVTRKAVLTIFYRGVSKP